MIMPHGTFCLFVYHYHYNWFTLFFFFFPPLLAGFSNFSLFNIQHGLCHENIRGSLMAFLSLCSSLFGYKLVFRPEEGFCGCYILRVMQ